MQGNAAAWGLSAPADLDLYLDEVGGDLCCEFSVSATSSFQNLLAFRRNGQGLSLRVDARRWWLALNVLALLAVALVFRFWKLENLPGINGDEAWYGIQAQAFLEGGQPAWKTPTRNPINIFFLGPQVLLHWDAEPSFWRLRIPAVISGIAALVVNFWLCRRVFGLPTAVVSTLILAVLPINIAYSRFSWDPAQSLLATSVVVYLAAQAARGAWEARTAADPVAIDQQMRNYLLMGAAALAVAILVHPTNLFLAPLLVLPLLIRWHHELLAYCQPRPVTAAKLACWGAALAAAAVIAVGGRHWFIRAVERLAQPGDLATFATLYVQLLWGVSCFRFLAGSCQGDALSGNLFDLAGLILAGALLVVVALYLVKQRPRTELALAAGYAIGLVGFFLIGGPSAIAPHFERYAIWMIAPAVLLVSRAMVWWATRTGPMLWYVTSAIAWLSLIAFGHEYFGFMQQTGGQSHRAMRTAEIEPKLAAWQAIVRTLPQTDTKAAKEAGPTLIVTTEYWIETPLQYLGGRRKDVQVLWWDGNGDWPPEVQAALEQNRARFVEFTTSKALPELRQRLEQQHRAWRETTILDYAQQPVIVILEPELDTARPEQHGSGTEHTAANTGRPAAGAVGLGSGR